ncbi:ribosomal protein L3 [Syntrophotalea carbinolica DSM 2380]|uniref:Large ribosomal subunit protein uL3 n=1 Tax=Syntrophotalea carbinolica (strain DSM 2380 / NBRC 103641 / GraBd1) TaxID=338963 RepID=RL3_SYNC1|nr:50S ribosomal protein L3 [Syntrophotalea carbinolica]Q3A6P7.1 RecName: Full=Large ribosomal subunit protein uL3; AltName: Full=50S ribosomal protein L3 [Syntrophotalea carbinolica DSM 2380]ABA87960.1 ribosomal protein L3 [Syntrophotalea carbinolica DSM 2380]
MTKGILGKKLGMTQVFAVDGKCIPVTVVEAGPCVVLQKKTEEKDGYNALQLGFGAKKTQSVNKPAMGHFKKSGKGAFEFLREVECENIDDHAVGDEITCDGFFATGDVIDVTGTSKGKGFQGVIKRWNFAGGRASHGSMFHRRPGGIGASAWPSRVFKGKKMAGQMGNKRVTTQGLEVVDVRPEKSLVLIKGAVPGPVNGLLLIRKSRKV